MRRTFWQRGRHAMQHFLDRATDRAVFYGSSGKAVKNQIEDGDTVILRLPDTDVTVTKVVAHSVGYRGIVSAFGSNPWREHAGYVLGQLVVFTERQVHTCIRP